MRVFWVWLIHAAVIACASVILNGVFGLPAPISGFEVLMLAFATTWTAEKDRERSRESR